MPQQLSVIAPRLLRTGVEHRAAPAPARLFATTYPCWSCQFDAPVDSVDCPACGAAQLEPSTVEGRSRPQIEYRAGRILGIR